MSLNKQLIIGNLGSDPELRYTQTGIPVATFSVASNREWKDRNGGSHKDVEWFRVVVWEKTGEACAKYLSKGRQVYVEGRTQTREFEDKDGNRRTITEVIAQSVKFLGSNPNAGKAVPPPAEAPADKGEAVEEILDGDIPF
jgi:single-strand DNA-binding protein